MNKFQEKSILKIMGKLFKKENDLSKLDSTLKYSEDSPVRYELMIEGSKYGKRTGFGLKIIPTMVSIFRNEFKTVNTLKNNPKNPKKEITAAELQQLKDFAEKKGAGLIGFAKLSEQLVFENKAVLHPNAIVLGFEMQKDKIDTAPSLNCQHEVMRTYDELGIISNKISRFLRKKGFSAHAGHPLMGAALYPPMAQRAGLAWIGYSGIMISPEYGPRFRLTAVYTSIENLPFSEDNEHAWVREYCDQCRRCIKECPGRAIYDEAIEHPSGRITHIENTKCMPHFVNEFGCSICIKVCPFNNVPYEILKSNFMK